MLASSRFSEMSSILLEKASKIRFALSGYRFQALIIVPQLVVALIQAVPQRL